MKSCLGKNKLLILIVTIFLLLNNLSLLVGLSKSLHTGDLIYSGAPNINRADYFVYLSMIELGRQGHLFMKNLYNIESQTSVFFSPQWYIIGQFGKLTGLDNATSYHIFRLMASFIFLSIIWWWLNKIFPSYKQKIVALLVVLFSSGLGTAFINIFPHTKTMPTNFWLPESVTFLTFSQGPIFIISQILLLSIFGLFIKGWQQEVRKKELVLSSCLIGCLVLIHPYDGFIIAMVLSLWILLQHVKFKKIVSGFIHIYAPLLLIAIYYIFIFTYNPAAGQLFQQNQVTSKEITDYLAGLGILIPLSLAGVWYLIKNKLHRNNYWLLLIIWTLVGWLLIYLPLPFNRRLANGWHFSLAVTSIFFLINFYKKSKPLTRGILISFFFMILFFETMIFIITDAVTTYQDQEHKLFYTTQDRAVYSLIKKNTSPQDIILTRGWDGLVIPAFTGRVVYVGHRIQTWQAEEKSRATYLIWTSQKNIEPWLLDNKINYIFASKKNIPEFLNIKWLAQETYLKPLIDNGNFILYKVIK